MSDTDTREAPASSPGRRSAPRVAALTILAHPDPRRLGERALLPRPRSGDPIALSRTELEFGPRARPLDDPYLSRETVWLRPSASALRIDAPGRARLIVDDHPVYGGAEIPLDDSPRVLVLRDRVALLLHHATVGAAVPSFGLDGRSAGVLEVYRAIERVADLDVPVLIGGETGVGKERVAQAIHAASGRAGPIVAVNVATLGPHLAASELFGHAAGAFTGAGDAKDGLFARADGGTLFLDEIGELDDAVQPMLLRALETGRVRPVGGRGERDVDVRIVSATDADLDDALRPALLHRLRGFEIAVPPLRARIEDLPGLALTLLEEELARTGEVARLDAHDPDAPSPISLDLMVRLARHPWPGNVRQLRGVLRQVVVASRGEPTLTADDAVERALATEPPALAPVDLDVRSALAAHGWSFAKAARALGVSRSALYRTASADSSIRTASDLDEAEIRAALDAHADLPAAASALEVSERALRLRMAALDLS